MTSMVEQIERAIADWVVQSPAAAAEAMARQRASWVRGMTARCEHGRVDFEQCGLCRDSSIEARSGETREAGLDPKDESDGAPTAQSPNASGRSTQTGVG